MSDQLPVELSIDHLILRGLPGFSPDEIERGLREELGRLLAARSHEDLRSITAENTGPIKMRVRPDLSALAFGHQLARTIAEALLTP